jgi:hypothetical protein
LSIDRPQNKRPAKASQRRRTKVEPALEEIRELFEREVPEIATEVRDALAKISTDFTIDDFVDASLTSNSLQAAAESLDWAAKNLTTAAERLAEVVGEIDDLCDAELQQ